MTKQIRPLGIFISFLFLLAGMSLAQSTARYRAFWVDTFNTSLNTHTDIVALVNQVKSANCNAIFAQVRRRGDSWYRRTLEPMADRTPIAAGFDPLDDLIVEAHAAGIEVHAFVIIGAIWNSDPTVRPPEDPNHVFLKHGFDPATGKIREGRDNWLTRTLLPDSGSTVSFSGYRLGSDFWIDLGHPDAAEYTLQVLMHLVRNYDLDGLHLDRIRYPEVAASLAGGASIGYNETSVARFQKRHGLPMGAAPPAANDPQWSQWRRDQVTQFVRRVYLNALALKPALKISAAVVAFGGGPQLESDWVATESYYRVFQDWRAWLEEGMLDFAVKMNYKRDHVVSQKGDFDEWAEWVKNHRYRREALIGLGAYLNSIEGTLPQLRRSLEPSALGNRAAGTVFYSLANTNEAVTANPLSIPAGQNTPKRSLAEFGSALKTGKSADGTQLYEDPSLHPEAVFAQPVAVPALAWKTAPEVGHVLGRVRGLARPAIDAGEITMTRVVPDSTSSSGRVSVTTRTDGSGYFGAIDLAPGQYRITVTPLGEAGETLNCAVTVVAGMVSQWEIDLVEDRGQVTTVSAANYCGPALAAESIAAAFGKPLATTVEAAVSQPLPTSMAGTSIVLRDGAGAGRPAPLFFVSPEQVNFLIPPGTAGGVGTVDVLNGNTTLSGPIRIVATAPGLFAANADARGVAAALVLRIKPDGSYAYEPATEFDSVQRLYFARPIDLGPESDQVFLVLFGTGMRSVESLTGVKATVDGIETEVLYAGASPDYVGLDQVNLRLPRALAGRGMAEIVVFVNGVPANPLLIRIK